MHLAYEANFWWLIVVAGMASLAVAAMLRRAAALRKLGIDKVGPGSQLRAVCKTAMRCLAAACIGVALLGPCFGERVIPTPPAQGRDLFVLLDVSRSMLSEDASPSRLECAKCGLAELGSRLEKHGGYRIGLIAFAERPVLLCPLTSDFRHFREELTNADLQSVRLRHDRTQSGTGSDLQLALERVLRLLPQADAGQPTRRCTDILLVSDGGDANDAALYKPAEAIKAQGGAVHTLGIGDPATDSPIPVKLPTGGRDLLRFEGELVRTRLQEAPLQQIATHGGGIYLPGCTGKVPTDALLNELAAKETRELGAETQTTVPIHRFQWFLLPAAVLLLCENLMSVRAGMRQVATPSRRAAWLERLVPQPQAQTVSQPHPVTQA